jgi:hypothetical protein
LSFTAAFIVRNGVEPGHTVTASVILLPPAAARVATDSGVEVIPVNPLLGVTTSTQLAAQVLSVLSNEAEFRAAVAAQENLAAYSVASAPRSPILSLSVESKDPGQAIAVVGRVIDQLTVKLDEQQTNVGADQRLSLQTIAQPAIASVDHSKLRVFAVTLTVGLLITLTGTILADGVLGRRRQHRPRSGDEQPVGDKNNGRGEQAAPPEHLANDTAGATGQQ